LRFTAYPAVNAIGPHPGLVQSTPQAQRIACILLFFIALLSTGNFHPLLFGASAPDEAHQFTGTKISLQQLTTVVLWALLIALSVLPGVLRAPPRFEGLFWPIMFLLYVLISSAWSSNPGSSAAKAMALLVCAAGAWRAASIVSVEQLFSCITYSYSTLAIASLAVVLLVPSIGITHEWQHEGFWQGVFVQKQGLGVSSALLLYTALLRLSRRWALFDSLACLLALVTLIGSGSRGGAVLAAVAAASLLITHRYRRLAPHLANLLVIELILANGFILFFALTGYEYIYLFGYQIDVTERTFIWQYSALSWLNHPLLGYGLGGFWTDPAIAYQYLRLHGWIVPDYHDGYIAIMVETGIIGMVLFWVTVVKLASRLRFLLCTRWASGLGLDLTVGYLILYFTINLTEGEFLRSTEFSEVIFSFLLVKVFTKPDAIGANRKAPPSWQLAGVRGSRGWSESRSPSAQLPRPPTPRRDYQLKTPDHRQNGQSQV
jgi:exopolysaccharide production protein ExoQ